MFTAHFHSIIEISAISICLFSAFIYLIKFLYNRASKDSLLFSLLFLSSALKVFTASFDILSFPYLHGNIIAFCDRIFSLVIILILQLIIRFKAGNPYRIQARNFLIRNHAFLTDISFALILIFIPREFSSFPVMIFSVIFLLRGTVSVFLRFLKKKDEKILYTGITFLITGVCCALFIDSAGFILLDDIYVICPVLIIFAVLRVFITARKSGLSRQLEIRLNERIQAAENAFMNAQMKPHFIYNALNTIADRCSSEPQEAERLILSLSKYMRQTLSYDSLSGITPLKKEIELVKAYADIECKRFDNIDVYYILPKELPELSLPPLTIQPLVENAIKHGLRKKHGGGYVAVTIKKTKTDMYLVSVEDNGVGINDDAKQAMLNLPKGSDSIGLYNINQRLISLYGSGLTIENPEDGGTRVYFELPYYKH